MEEIVSRGRNRCKGPEGGPSKSHQVLVKEEKRRGRRRRKAIRDLTECAASGLPCKGAWIVSMGSIWDFKAKEHRPILQLSRPLPRDVC